MPISNDHVKQTETLTSDLGDLIKNINPVTDKEWDAFNKLVDAHKNLMKVDTDSLRQLPLPLEPKAETPTAPREDCPRCKGTGSWIDPADSTKSSRPCICDQVDDKRWPKVKKEWEELLAPVGKD